MAPGLDKEESKEAVDPGDKKYGKLLRMFREGYLSVCVYKNVHQHKIFYDIVIFRKLKITDKEFQWKRGTNLKPTDMKDLLTLIVAADEFLKSLELKKID